MIKRLFDIVIALLVIILLLPIYLLIALLIRLDSAGGVVFQQKRVGLYGAPFFMYKFRSMVKNADKQGYQTQKNDLRITKVGKFIRKTSIDELPQLLNVIKGEMSIIGPRPNVFAQKDFYSKTQWEKRNSVRPGITGLAQALLRSSATADERTKLDLEYVDKHSFFYDIKIIMLTIKQILFTGNTN